MILNKVLTSSNTKVLEANLAENKTYATVAIFFCNTSTTASNVNIYVVPNGSLPSTSNMIVNKLTVEAEDTVEFEMEKIILDKGAAIYAKADKGNITATISYVEM